MNMHLLARLRRAIRLCTAAKEGSWPSRSRQQARGTAGRACRAPVGRAGPGTHRDPSNLRPLCRHACQAKKNFARQNSLALVLIARQNWWPLSFYGQRTCLASATRGRGLWLPASAGIFPPKLIPAVFGGGVMPGRCAWQKRLLPAAAARYSNGSSEAAVNLCLALSRCSGASAPEWRARSRFSHHAEDRR